MDNEFIKRMEELALRAEKRGAYTYSEFLSPSRLSEAEAASLPTAITAYGGADFAERKIIRFGSFGYDEDYPIRILNVKPLNKKFAKPVTHRDFLGSILSLGVERDRLGDIFIKDGEAFIPVVETLSEFICENLIKVGQNSVFCAIVDGVPDELAPECEALIVSVSSVRLDAILCRVYNLSREEGVCLFKEGKVFVNGRQIEAPSFTPSAGDVITVRGYGKTVFDGECGRSAKGKLRVRITRFK